MEGTDCLSVCPKGQYGTREFSIRGDVSKSYCSTCDSQCVECIGSGSEKCTRCPKGYYLQKTLTSNSYGSCVQKETDSAEYQIHITTATGLNFVEFSEQTGDFSAPYDEILNALTSIDELCADVINTCTVTIFLQRGTHYINRVRKNIYLPTNEDKYSMQVKLTIMPYYCQPNDDPKVCYEEGEKAIIKNKIG